MPFRPSAPFRKNIQGVVLPLTAGIARLYGLRPSDGAYPLGAFYTEHISPRRWRHVGGIWYQAVSLERIQARRIRSERVQEFVEGILGVGTVQLSSGTVIVWEPLPIAVVQQLPPPIL